MRLMSGRRRGRVTTWPPVGGPYRDERLAYLAAAAELRRRARRRHGFASAIGVLTLGVLTNDLPDSSRMGGNRTRRRHARLMFACNEAAGMLDALERQQLRQRGELPAWFYEEVERLSTRNSRRRKNALT
jgi:hypothetical protein